MYRVGLKTVDAMYGQVIAMLRRKGALDERNRRRAFGPRRGARACRTTRS